MALNENPTLQEIVDEVERLNNLIVNRGGTQTITPKTSNQTLNKGYYKGNITVKGDSNLVASNIVKGKSIFGIAGSATVSSLGGKKWAEGTSSSIGSTFANFTYAGTTSKASLYYVDIALDFVPSTIVASGISGSSNNEFLCVLNNKGTIYAKNVKVATYDADNYNTYTYNLKNDSLVNLGNNVYRLPFLVSGFTVKWIAYE